MFKEQHGVGEGGGVLVLFNTPVTVTKWFWIAEYHVISVKQSKKKPQSVMFV